MNGALELLDTYAMRAMVLQYIAEEVQLECMALTAGTGCDASVMIEQLHAYVQGLVDVVEWLLQTPSVTEQKDGRRDSPLMLARRCGHSDIVGLLVAAGAKDPASSRVTQSLNPSEPTKNLSWLYASVDIMQLCKLKREMHRLDSVGRQDVQIYLTSMLTAV